MPDFPEEFMFDTGKYQIYYNRGVITMLSEKERNIYNKGDLMYNLLLEILIDEYNLKVKIDRINVKE